MVPQQKRNRDLPDRRYVNTRLFLYSRAIEVFLTREVDADSAVSDEFGGDLEFLTWHTADDNIAERQAILERPTGLVVHVVVLAFQPSTAREELDVVDVDGVDCGTVVGEEGGEGTANDFGAVNDCDGAAMEAVSVGEDAVIDAEVFEDFDDGEGGTGEDALEGVVRGVKEADVLIHVENVAMREPLDVLV